MDKIAIIGASYLQEPLIEKAKEMGLETHVFAWAAGDVGEKSADVFYPISIVEKEKILEKCREIGVCGVCSIASDLAAITVNYVAENMGLVGNSMESTFISTNKNAMRKAFEKNGDPSPKSIVVTETEEVPKETLKYPVIVKPTDRSGSRGITKLETPERLREAIAYAKDEGFEKTALVEEYVTGQEYSVECISYHGQHHFLAITQKYTTGTPHFIETGHLEPAPLSIELIEKIKKTVFHALDSLLIKNSASHAELKVDSKGEIKIIEIGGRMGGDFIGSDLVHLSTGVDFVKAVIQVAIGEEPNLKRQEKGCNAAVRFIFSQEDIDILDRIKRQRPEILVRYEVSDNTLEAVRDSSSRHGYFLMCASSFEDIRAYLPTEGAK